MTAPPRIRFRSITKSFGATAALSNVSFEVPPGCVHALVGENGAGKSTLMRILAGAIELDSGTIELDGAPAPIHDSRSAQALGVAMVHQEFSLIPDLSVAENVYLGRWPRHPWTGVIQRERLGDLTRKLLNDLDLRLPVGAPVRSLSIAQQQLVEIAKALSLQARVLILDEPSAVLTPHELVSLFRLIRQLTARGVSVMYISHRLDEIFELAQYVTVLRDGRHISTRPIVEQTRQQLITECVGRPLETEFPRRKVALGQTLLCVENLTNDGTFADVSFDIREGEVLGLTGLVGAGRTSVAKAIFGAVTANHGTVLVGEARGPFRSPIAAKRAGVAYLPEDRRREGLLMARSVRENLTLAHRSQVAKFGLLNLVRERKVSTDMVESLRIRTAGVESPAASLSGGNQQKCLLGRWLQSSYRVMLLDEPTRGVDVGAKAEIYDIINDLAARGRAILMISSELPEIIGMSDRIAVMCRGMLAGMLDNQDRQVTQETIMRLAIGEQAA